MEYQHPQTLADPDGFEIILVGNRKVSCDGGGGPLGHPRVFLKMETDETDVVCPYCSRRFALKGTI